MPLLTPIQTINATLADEARQCANHIASASVAANRMTTVLLRLGNTELSDWLNSQPPQDIQELMSAHGQLGEALNQSATIGGEVLSSSGITVGIPTVDTRSLIDKLADTRRIVEMVDGKFVVSTLPPPEPNPDDHPEENLDYDHIGVGEGDMPDDPEPISNDD
jgi:hypothetical protein